MMGNDDSRKFQITIANVMLAMACLAVVLALLRCYPPNPLGLITVDMRNAGAEAILSGLIATTGCGAVGAFCNCFHRSLAIGGVMGCAVAAIWWIGRIIFLVIAAGSV
jgi:hypothetical protein